MTDEKQNDEKVETVRVRAVKGARVLDEVTNLPLEGEVEVPRTRAIERRIAAGDLEEVGGKARELGVVRGDDEAKGLEKERY